MKNFLKLFGVIALVMAIGFFMAACGEDEEEAIVGKLTIVGFDFDETNKFVMADAWVDGIYYFAAAGYANGVVTLGEIKNKIVTLSVWEHKGAVPELYAGSEEITFDVYLFLAADDLENDNDNAGEEEVEVQFVKGIGIGSIEP